MSTIGTPPAGPDLLERTLGESLTIQRRRLLYHDAHTWVRTPRDLRILMEHQVFAVWADEQLGAEPEPALERFRFRMRQQGANTEGIDAFTAIIAATDDPAAALGFSGAPESARPLVEHTWELTHGPGGAALAGARAMGGADIDWPAAAADLARACHQDPDQWAVAHHHAHMAVADRIHLYDGVAQAIRMACMAMHPSVGRRPA